MDQKLSPLVVDYLCFSCGHMNHIEVPKPLRCEACDAKAAIRKKAYSEVLSILDKTGDILYNVHMAREHMRKELL